MGQDGILEDILGAGAGWARMARTAAEDMALALNPLGNGDEPADWLDA